jgi:hypothetical protein
MTAGVARMSAAMCGSPGIASAVALRAMADKSLTRAMLALLPIVWVALHR